MRCELGVRRDSEVVAVLRAMNLKLPPEPKARARTTSKVQTLLMVVRVVVGLERVKGRR